MVVEEKPVQVEGDDAGGENPSKKAAKKLAKEAAKAAKVSYQFCAIYWLRLGSSD